MKRLARRSILILVSMAVGTAPALAWGPQGHRVIARVAVDRLTPEAKAAIRELLHEGDTLPLVADWADHEGHDKFPRSGPWHFVNVPLTADRYDPARDCKRGECVVEKIKVYRKILADRSAPKEERQVALLFLVHFVSDIHQPLHVGDNQDHGGNDTQVQFFGRGTSLHRLWDSELIHRIGGDDRAWTDRIERKITPVTTRTWSAGKVEDWADETLKAAKVAYRNPGGNGAPMVGGERVEDAYLRVAEPILVEQMARAGVRLANDLNAAFR